eukprot:Unigene11269_Nuclearia_a/m.34426 Unigene11269_Nuclearia_a/g.34426  ORF Unigene11269_Nuclearia_a/g.34426 Unigene11269_Nuclearia_a/m.34426 type:complete len:323 (-) Unigene11269_Nuclearia_a:89-1057(-)
MPSPGGADVDALVRDTFVWYEFFEVGGLAKADAAAAAKCFVRHGVSLDSVPLDDAGLQHVGLADAQQRARVLQAIFAYFEVVSSTSAAAMTERTPMLNAATAPRNSSSASTSAAHTGRTAIAGCSSFSAVVGSGYGTASSSSKDGYCAIGTQPPPSYYESSASPALPQYEDTQPRGARMHAQDAQDAQDAAGDVVIHLNISEMDLSNADTIRPQEYNPQWANVITEREFETIFIEQLREANCFYTACCTCVCLTYCLLHLTIVLIPVLSFCKQSCYEMHCDEIISEIQMRLHAAQILFTMESQDRNHFTFRLLRRLDNRASQ